MRNNVAGTLSKNRFYLKCQRGAKCPKCAKLLIAKPQDIVVMEEKIGNIEALDFITQTKQLPNQKPIIFCLIVKQMPDYETAQRAKESGVQYFIPDQNMDTLFDCV